MAHDSQTDLYNTPKYEHMVFAAAMGYGEADIQDQASIDQLFCDSDVISTSGNANVDNHQSESKTVRDHPHWVAVDVYAYVTYFSIALGHIV